LDGLLVVAAPEDYLNACCLLVCPRGLALQQAEAPFFTRVENSLTQTRSNL